MTLKSISSVGENPCFDLNGGFPKSFIYGVWTLVPGLKSEGVVCFEIDVCSGVRVFCKHRVLVSMS